MSRLLVVVVHHTDPPARLGQWLRDAGLELDERHLSNGDELPTTLDGFDGMVVLGGPQSALDDDATSPELVGVRDLLRQALAADFPTLAICLGAQLLAQVGGGKVREGIDGPEVGALLVAKRDTAETDPLFRPLPLTPDVLHTYHLIPRAAGKSNAVATHMRRRGLRPEETIAIGDSRGDLEVATVVGRFYLVSNGLAKDPDVLDAAPPGADVVVTEEPMTAGFYEAIVRSLAER